MKDLQPRKQCTQVEVHATHEDVLPSIELDVSKR